MIYKRLAFPLLILPLILCLACVPATTRTATAPRSAASGPQAALDAADLAYGQGQFRAAAEHYKKFLSLEPDSPRLEPVLASYGLAAEKAGLFGDAASAYERLIREFPGGRFTAEAQPRLANVYMAGGDAVRAENLAAMLLPAETDPARRTSLQMTLADSQWLRGRYAEATANFLTAWRGAQGPAKAEAQEGVLAGLSRLNQASLEEVQRQYGQNFPGPEATYLLARLAAQSGDAARVALQAEHFARYFNGHPLMPQMQALAAGAGTEGFAVPAPVFGQEYDPRLKAAPEMALPTIPAALGPIGGQAGGVSIVAVLPLTDKNAAQYAQAIASGLGLAFKTFAPGGGINLSVQDSKGSEQEAARLVAQAAANPQVLAVVGPFTSRESGLPARTAQEAGLPMIVISQRNDLTGLGPNIFRLFLTPRHQAESVARYAVRVQGHQQLGILYPEDNYGRQIRSFFENEVRRLGAQLAAADSYDPQAKDWEEAVKRLTGGKVNRRVSTNYQAETTFTTLYIPDSAPVVAQIMAQLAFYDVTKMPYLGSSLWLSQSLLDSSAADFAQGSVIPVAFSELSGREEIRRFISAYQAAYGRAPNQYAAYGYDAGLALIQALGQGAATRDDLRRQLSLGSAVPGVTGPFRFDQSGEYVVDPTLLSVQGREFILLREAGPGAGR
ncbi:MAG: penicillin-binding protein activator [Candidatus Adiutrix sp.]|jgi:ABC-type branched-subunit amino acid transport system substrate-binding protein|nr:penicillin-binding protein activator [Candidatus Adiutrix sp.]